MEKVEIKEEGLRMEREEKAADIIESTIKNFCNLMGFDFYSEPDLVDVFDGEERYMYIDYTPSDINYNDCEGITLRLEKGFFDDDDSYQQIETNSSVAENKKVQELASELGLKVFIDSGPISVLCELSVPKDFNLMKVFIIREIANFEWKLKSIFPLLENTEKLVRKQLEKIRNETKKQLENI